MEVGRKVVLQLSRPERLHGAISAACGPGQDLKGQHTGSGAGKEHIQQRADGGVFRFQDSQNTRRA
jgi:hypothetical protein